MNNRIRILATSDVHGYVYPYSYGDGLPEDIGFAKLHTLISSLKDENTLIINNGDDLQGSPLAYYHSQQNNKEISPVTKVMNATEYDYVNLGNHDFNYGEGALITHITNLQAPTLTSNILYRGKPIGPTYVIREIAGKKIAIFGVTTQYIPNWEKPENIKNFKFHDAYQTAKRTVELVRSWEKPDYVIGVYHGGLERDPQTGEPTEDLTKENEGYAMMRDIPGLDVLITGHQHRSICGKLFHTYYTQTAANGAELACIDIYTDTNTIETHILKSDMESDPDIEALVQSEEDACQKWLDTPLGTTKVNLEVTDEDEARLTKHQVITFLNNVSKEVSGADICANALFLHAKGFPREITMRHLVNTYPFPNTLVVKKINGRILREYLEKDADFWSIKDDRIIVSPWHDFPKPSHYNYDMLDGIEYVIKVSNPIGSRIVSLTRNGEEVQDDDEFTLCVNNYRATGGGDYYMLKDAPVVKVIDTPVVELIASYIQEHKTIDFEPVHNITVIK